MNEEQLDELNQLSQTVAELERKMQEVLEGHDSNVILLTLSNLAAQVLYQVDETTENDYLVRMLQNTKTSCMMYRYQASQNELERKEKENGQPGI